MLVKIQNLRSGPHGFSDDPRLQFKAGEIKEIDPEWLKRFDNPATEALFKGPIPAFRVVRADETPEVSAGLMSLLAMPASVAKPAQEPAPVTVNAGPKTEAELLAAINDQQAKAQAAGQG